MSKNKIKKQKSDIFFGVSENDTMDDIGFVEVDPKEFEFIVPTEYAPEKLEELIPEEDDEYDEDEEDTAEEKVKKVKPVKEKVKKTPEVKTQKKPAKKAVSETNKKKSSSKKEKAPAKVKKEQSTAGFIITVTLKLLVICAVVAAMLAFVYSITDPIIKENEYRKKEAAIAEFFPEKTSFEAMPADIDDVDELFVVYKDAEKLGYCASVSPSGFGGAIKMMVGVGFGKTIIGVKVIEHAETAGVGTNALSGEYLSKYIGEHGDRIILGETVDAYASATITSTAVNDGINAALAANDAVFGGEDAIAERVMPEGTVSIDEAFHGADGYGGFYGWLTDVEHIEEKAEEGFSPFDEFYLFKAKKADGSVSDNGYAAIVTVTSDSGWAKIMVGTYYKTQLGIRFLDYEGEGFKTLALDSEYLKGYKQNIANPIALVYGETIPVHPSADLEARAIAEKASEVLAFYPEYLEKVTAVTADEEVIA